MPAILLLLFVIVPIVEIVVIIQVGQVIGGWWTVALLVVDSLLGAWLLRREGARTWKAFRQALQDGRWPGDEVAQGAMVIVGGTLLLTPGFVTDAVGFVLLIPVSRRILSRTVRSRVRSGVVGGPAGAAATSAAGAAGAAGAAAARRRNRRRASDSAFDVEVVEIYREDRHDTGRNGELEGRLVEDPDDDAEVVDDPDGGGDTDPDASDDDRDDPRGTSI